MEASSKNVWGPRGWAWLHTIAINFPSHPQPSDKAAAHARFWSFVLTLPCSECRYHASAYAKKYAPDYADSESFQTWAWRFHNAVNRRLGKPLMSAEEYRDTYAEEMNQTYWKYV